jgi:immune inhibitor A
MAQPQASVLDGVDRIYRAAAESDDGQRCMVAPSPELQDRIEEELAAATEAFTALPFAQVRAAEPDRPGLNDGLIIPGRYYAAGTPPSVVRTQAADRAPLRGVVRVIVVLVDFSDKQMAANQDVRFAELFFSVGTHPTGSVRDYFREASHGLVDVDGQVVGTYRLPKPLEEYANGESGTGSTLPNARTMAADAAVAADPDVNLGPYDNDGNGYVDAFVVVHAGNGAEQTGSGDDIWSHKWVLPNEFTGDGAKIYAYLTIPEDALLGVSAHELGHLLFGWPDLYDTDNTSNGIGNWCLMASGSWNDGGDTPAHPSAWCKVDQGWATVSNQASNAIVSIPDVKASYTVHRLWKEGSASPEFFLVENRQRTGFDANLPADGLLVWHVDTSIAGNQNEAHPKVALQQADARRDLELRANRGDDGDPYPGSADARRFEKDTTPSSRSYAGTDTCVAITEVSDPAATMTARLAVRCATTKRKEAKGEKPGFKEQGKDALVDNKPLWDKFTREKRPEKPTTDKLDKRPDTLGDWWRRFGVAPTGEEDATSELAALRERVAALEARLAVGQPFIGQALRPDLSQGAFLEEEDLPRTQTKAITDVFEKRLLDAPPTGGA